MSEEMPQNYLKHRLISHAAKPAAKRSPANWNHSAEQPSIGGTAILKSNAVAGYLFAYTFDIRYQLSGFMLSSTTNYMLSSSPHAPAYAPQAATSQAAYMRGRSQMAARPSCPPVERARGLGRETMGERHKRDQ